MFGLLVPLVEEMPPAEVLLELLFLEIIADPFWPEATALLLDLCEPREGLLVKSLFRL